MTKQQVSIAKPREAILKKRFSEERCGYGANLVCSVGKLLKQGNGVDMCVCVCVPI